MEVVKFFVLTCCILPRCTIFILFQQNNSIKERKKLSIKAPTHSSKSVSFLVITFFDY